MALVAEREADLGRLASGVEHGQPLHRHQPVVERLRWLVGIEAGLPEELRIDVHLLEVAVLDRDAVAHALPPADVDDVLRQILVPDLREVGGHLVAEVILAAPVMRHTHEDVGRAALAHQRREVLRLVALIRHGDDLELVCRLLLEKNSGPPSSLASLRTLLPVSPQYSPPPLASSRSRASRLPSSPCACSP